MAYRVGDRVRYLGPKEKEPIPIKEEYAKPGDEGVITWVGGNLYPLCVEIGGTPLPLAEHEVEPA